MTNKSVSSSSSVWNINLGGGGYINMILKYCEDPYECNTGYLISAVYFQTFMTVRRLYI